MEPSEPIAHSSVASRVLALIDHTSLGDDDTPEVITTLCGAASNEYGHVASICTWPRFIALAHELLGGGEVGIAAVVNFPTGLASPADTAAEAAGAVGDGATEIDLVVPWEAHRDGNSTVVAEMVATVRGAIPDHVVLKTILETGELGEADLIRSIASQAAGAGADFLKTSTGKTAHGATPEAVAILLDVASEFRSEGHTVGVKVSGGVRDVAGASEYLAMVDEKMGPTWATSFTFRFGASSLLPDVVRVLSGSSGSDLPGATTDY
ncbi:MAG: deoxyribose-phosphate aldolase [Actinomycetia bacterium]|nr:deoxyribose-phosphate aldolase [Actinomycetes bacterium]MCP4958458.1 deoxyribose-phosphate aldolase [Actinomycetes bacterium]